MKTNYCTLKNGFNHYLRTDNAADLHLPMPNTTVNLTAHQLRWWVPSALRAPAAGYLPR